MLKACLLHNNLLNDLLLRKTFYIQTKLLNSKFNFRKHYSMLRTNKHKGLAPPTKYPGTKYSFKDQCQSLAAATNNRDMFPIYNPVKYCFFSFY